MDYAVFRVQQQNAGPVPDLCKKDDCFASVYY
ncbi:hypothetical protein J2W55_004650 [Mucilaginibacter pocheonensis]|uniref:Uncharacterized protein n=1 Tax=Mucilaginibacter pocheonensis TaxID=398050 RepID=A0ABU1TIX3_9SPHI|nr:hypothetical protein [Mucilaginibacter pocheonensis]